MTKDDIIRMAREAGLVDPMVFYASYERFANLVATHKAEIITAEAYRCGYEAGVVEERESCAKVCERDDSIRCLAAAQAIRARGSK